MKRHTVFYQLVNINGRLRLKLWEPATATSCQKKRHRFAVNYSVASEMEAQQLIDQYVKANQAKARCFA